MTSILIRNLKRKNSNIKSYMNLTDVMFDKVWSNKFPRVLYNTHDIFHGNYPLQ